MSEPRPGQMRIGEQLESARLRASLDLAEVEARTKIRAKYLVALEQERWAELPSDAYAKGFLRSYAESLGLDGEALVDEYRRQVGGEEPDPAPPRRRPAIAPLLAIAAVVVLGVVALAALIGGDDEGPKAKPRPDGSAARDRDRSRAAPGTVALVLDVREPVEVCLLGGGNGALIDGQLLAAGDQERFERKRFELRFPSGFEAAQVRVKIGGEQGRLPRRDGPAAYAISPPARVRALGPPGERCP